MAAADVEDRIFDGFKGAESFLITDKQSIVTNSAPAGKGGSGAGGLQQTVVIEADRFPLQEQSFVDLQIYLKAAMKLPKNETMFKATYPESFFQEYVSSDKDHPGPLYTFMFQTLTGIHQHCSLFQSETMNGMMILSAQIALFSGLSAQGVERIMSCFEIILADGANWDDPSVKNASEDVSNTLEHLKVKAMEANRACKETWKGLSDFKTTTDDDKDLLKQLVGRMTKVLPTMACLNEQMRKQAEITNAALNSLAKAENTAAQKIENKSGIQWYYFIGVVGLGFAIADTVSKNEAEKQLVEASAQYSRIFKDANDSLRTVLQFRERLRHLNDNIQTVSEAIEKAETAIQDMMNAFTNLLTSFGSIAADLDNAKGMIGGDLARRRKAARENFLRARNMWIKVQDLARRFQQNGLVLEKKVEDIPKNPDPYPWLEILSANYGGVNVTPFAKVLFNYGDSIRVRSVEPGFEEPWKGVIKSISVYHKLVESQRIFACKEHSKSKIHDLGPVKSIAEARAQAGDAVLNEISPMNAPANCKVKILCILWGPNEIRKQSAYDYCYNCLDKAPVVWENAYMGEDTWNGHLKSGTIYYQVQGSQAIGQCTGREHTQSAFTSAPLS